MGILERAKQMAETGSFELPEGDKNKSTEPKKQDSQPKKESKGEHKQNPVIKYFKEVRDELKKVEWPKRTDVVRGTVIVIVLSVALALLLGGADHGFSYLLQKGLEVFK